MKNTNVNDIRSRRAQWARKWRYGISKSQFYEMVEKRKGKCDLCNKVPTGKKKTLVVDHNHSTNEIRGLLCNKCNIGLGYLGDSNDIPLRVFNYLQKTNLTVYKQETQIRNELYTWMKDFF